jgi:hypothetical protein
MRGANSGEQASGGHPKSSCVISRRTVFPHAATTEITVPPKGSKNRNFVLLVNISICVVKEIDVWRRWLGNVAWSPVGLRACPGWLQQEQFSTLIQIQIYIFVLRMEL